VALLSIGLMFVVLAHQPGLNPPAALNSTGPSDKELVSRYLSGCTDEKCVMDAVTKLTEVYDPGRAIAVLEVFQRNKPAKYMGDPHIWAHQAGVVAAKKYGISGETFLKCPTTFNYGCTHGFFESASLKASSLKQTIENICGTLETNEKFSRKHKFYCYHGSGHGVMQTLDYDIDQSLAVCDSLNSAFGTEGCWQGAFMEGDNAANQGEAPPGAFSEKDHPLAPCDRVAAKYQIQCFINLPGRLIILENNDPIAAARHCLNTTEENRKVCFDGMGIVISNDSWQMLQPQYRDGELVANAWKICQQFPEGYLDRCVFGVVAGITNVDQYKTDRAIRFCKTVNDNLKSWCFQSLGNDLRGIAPTVAMVSRQCSEVPAAYVKSCRQGAHL
jgi:hypothetical protein